MPFLNLAAWVATSSVKGTVLIFAVILLRRFLAPASASPWRHAVWLPAFACLICPLGLRLPLAASFGSSLPAAIAAPLATSSVEAIPSRTLGRSDVRSDRLSAQIGTRHATPDSALPVFPAPPRGAARRSLLPWLALIWATGAAGLASLHLANLLKFRRVRRAAHPVEGDAERVFEACRTELRMRRKVRLLQSGEADSPTLFGWWHPTLLLPLGLHGHLDAPRLRYVFLHELAHVKRNDVLVNWLAALAQLVHWFNPTVWLAGRLMRSDMESACDAAVLHRLSGGERGPYGDVLVHLADSRGSAVPTPYAVGIADGHADLKGRLIMIARFRPASIRIRFAAGLALAAFTSVALIQPGLSSPSGARPGAVQGPPLAGASTAAASPTAQSAPTGGVPLRVLIEQVAANIHKRVIADPRAASTVILYGQSLDQITYADFLTILRINGFTAVDVNNYINVIPIAEVRWLPLPNMPKRGDLPDDQFANMSIELRNACAYRLIPILRPWLPAYAYLAAASSDTVLAIDTYANLKRVRSVITELDNRAKPGHCGGAAPK